jgi:hypothetical protein
LITQRIFLNNVHFIAIHVEQCSITPQEINMQTLVSEVVTTFVGDAQALLTGFARAVLRILMAPVERLAEASDVAGVLAMRRRMSRAARAQADRARRVLNYGARNSYGGRRRRGPLGCLGALGELT